MVLKIKKIAKYKPIVYVVFFIGLLLIGWILWDSITTIRTCSSNKAGGCSCGKKSGECSCGKSGGCSCGKKSGECSCGKAGEYSGHRHYEGMTGSQTLSNWSDFVDVIYYINLDKREDRKKEFLDEMDRMGVPSNKIVRIPGVYKPGQGDWGCSLSHVNAIQKMVNSNHKNCVIFEDDYEFTVDNKDAITKTFQSLIDNNVDYDVIMFSANEVKIEPSEYPNLNRVYDAQTTSGYMVNAKFAQTLLENYQEGATLIENSYIENGKVESIQLPYCIDQYWKKLQPKSKWYVFSPKLGKQRSSISDIQGGFVNMTV